MFPPALLCFTAIVFTRDECTSCISYSVHRPGGVATGCCSKSSYIVCPWPQGFGYAVLGASGPICGHCLCGPICGHCLCGPICGHGSSGPICGHCKASVQLDARHSFILFIIPDTNKILSSLTILWEKNKVKICNFIVRYYPRPQQESRRFENFHGLFCSRNFFYLHWSKLLAFSKSESFMNLSEPVFFGHFNENIKNLLYMQAVKNF